MIRVSYIVKLYGHSAERVMQMLDDDPRSAVEHMKQWETEDMHTCVVESIGNPSDFVFGVDDYLILVNYHERNVMLVKVYERN